jgi:rhodanese-related sulfurtransferase
MQEISVEDAAKRLNEDPSFVLLDVREADELARVKVEGATWIPMAQIPQRIGELDKTKSIAVMCHHGGRSERVAGFLVANGFSDIANVDGGIDAYAERVDRSLARY